MSKLSKLRTTMNWSKWLMTGGALVFARHIGVAVGFFAQVVWEGFLQGVTMRKTLNKDTSSLTDTLPGLTPTPPAPPAGS